MSFSDQLKHAPGFIADALLEVLDTSTIVRQYLIEEHKTEDPDPYVVHNYTTLVLERADRTEAKAGCCPADPMTVAPVREGDVIRLLVPTSAGFTGEGIVLEDQTPTGVVVFRRVGADPDDPPSLAIRHEVQIISRAPIT
jgi:hypothetical protein